MFASDETVTRPTNEKRNDSTGEGDVMSGGATPATGERAESADLVQSGARRGRRRWAIVAVVLALIAAVGVVAVVALCGVFDGDGGDSRSSDNGSATSLATVERRSLSETTQFNGTLGYAGSYTVLGQAHGIVTMLPAPGQVIRNGQVLYRVDGAPVVLLYGDAPAYRTLAEGATGTDVAQLNHDLVALGYVDRADVDVTWMSSPGPPRPGWRSCRTISGLTRPARSISATWCSCRPLRG
jgi:hypothetical protein